MRHHQVIVGRDGAGDTGAGLQPVFAHTQAIVLQPAHEIRGEHGVQRARHSGLANAGAEPHQFLQPFAAMATAEHMRFDIRGGGCVRFTQPVRGEIGMTN